MSDNKDMIKKKLNEIFRQVFNQEELQVFDTMAAKDVEGWDSLTNVLLIVAIERAFNLKFATGEIIDLRNVGEIVSLIQNKLSES